MRPPPVANKFEAVFRPQQVGTRLQTFKKPVTETVLELTSVLAKLSALRTTFTTCEHTTPRANRRVNFFLEILIGTVLLLAGLWLAKECLEIRSTQKRGRN